MRPIALTLAALLVGGPAMADDRTLSGEVFYLPRIALPADALLHLRLTDAGGAVLLDREEPALGRHVPLPFALPAPRGVAVTLEAGIRSGGAALWAALPLPVAAGSEDRVLAPIRLDRPAMPEESLTYRCGDDELTFGLLGETARMALGGRVWTLLPEPAASGARMVAEGDATTWLWSKGAEAILSLAGEERLCHQVPRVPSFPLVATGTEPFWRLEVAEGRASFRPMDGAPVEGILATAVSVPEGERYALEGADLTFTLSRRLCRDAMTGMPHPFTVTVETGGARLAGCGGEPAALLEGTEWRVTALGAAELPAAVEVTMAFAGGRVAGGAGCNRYGAGLRFSGEGIEIGPAMSTMMACPEAQMRIERQFLTALGRITRFDVTPDGRLVLYDGDSPAVTARRG